jgi:hypothetical protein
MPFNSLNWPGFAISHAWGGAAPGMECQGITSQLRSHFAALVADSELPGRENKEVRSHRIEKLTRYISKLPRLGSIF